MQAAYGLRKGKRGMQDFESFRDEVIKEHNGQRQPFVLFLIRRLYQYAQKIEALETRIAKLESMLVDDGK